MKILYTLIYFFLSLQDGNTGLVNAQNIYTRTEGEDVTVPCFFSFPRRWKFLCKEKCEERILIETRTSRALRGRYSIRYESSQSRETLFVTITQLNKADTGRYRCVVGRGSRALYEEFEVIVVDASSSLKKDTSVQDLSASSTTTPLTTQSSSSRPSSFTPSSSIKNYSGVLLCVGLTLVCIVVLLSLAVLIIYIKRNIKLSGLRTRGNLNAANIELPLHKNQLSVFTPEEPTYQRLDAATRDENQIYSTITQKKI